MSPREPSDEPLTREEFRLKEDRERKKYWKRWGPYVAERQWGTGACFSCWRILELDETDAW